MDNGNEWVDFKAVKALVTIEMVLDHYNLTGLKKTGQELRGKCPIHRGTNNKHFTANLTKNAFKCFFAQCGARGNVLDLVAALEQCSIRDAALKLRDWFKVGESESLQTNEPGETGDTDVTRGIYTDSNGSLFEVVLSALSGEDFEALVVYRELFGDYRFFVAPVENFGLGDCPFTLIKAF